MTSGWLGLAEVNRVRYDSDQVSIEQMERWLQEAGTYIRTVPPVAADPAGGGSR